MNNITKCFTSLIVVFLSFFACKKETNLPDSDTSSIQAMAKAITNLNGTKWNFVNYSKEKLPANLERKATLQFTDQSENKIHYSGKSFVNNYRGMMSIDDGKGLIIEQGQGMSTLMAALDETLNQAESKYYANIAKAQYFEVSSTTLRIYLGDKNASSVEVMNFEK